MAATLAHVLTLRPSAMAMAGLRRQCRPSDPVTVPSPRGSGGFVDRLVLAGDEQASEDLADWTLRDLPDEDDLARALEAGQVGAGLAVGVEAGRGRVRSSWNDEG